MAVVALLGGRDTLDRGADARVEITLDRAASIDSARTDLIASAAGAWQATRVAESTEDDSATVEFALPGSSLDGFVADLRRFDGAQDVEVALEVDPSQVTPEPLATAGEEQAADPVRVEVTLERSSAGGPWLTIGGAVLVAAMALIALVMVQRRFSNDDYDDVPQT